MNYLASVKRSLCQILLGNLSCSHDKKDLVCRGTLERLQTLLQWWKPRARPRINTVAHHHQNREQRLYRHHENIPSFSLYVVLYYTSYTRLLSSFLPLIFLLFKEQYFRTVFALFCCSCITFLHNLKHSSKNDQSG